MSRDSNDSASDKKMESVEEYGKTFLEKYFRGKAESEIARLSVEVETAKSASEIAALRLKMQQVQQELAQNMEIIHEDPNKTKAREEDLDKKTAEIDLSTFNGQDFFKHNRALIPTPLWDYLFPYQQEGVKWLLDLHQKSKGGILADEMGLGKTVQVIAFITGLFYSGQIENVLILCPATVVSQWTAQLKSILTTQEVHASTSRNSAGIFVMSYENYKMKACRDGRLFDTVILDEGHKIKNKAALVTICSKSIKSRSRFILTGTPVQNNLSELWSLFDFAVPGLLGTNLTFQEEFEDRIKNRSSSERAYKYSVMLRALVEPYILRRLKIQVSHKLPGRVDRVIFVSLSSIQHSLYVAALESKRVRTALLTRQGILGAIDHLRKICNHPSLLHKNPHGHTNDEEELISSSSKMNEMIHQLRKWDREKCRVLIFTQTIQMQVLIEEALTLYRFSYLKMSGQTSIKKRGSLVEKFNGDSSIFIFLLTTRVGGLGLNLTGANRIILFDPDWNPSTDNQAKERIYRYGQSSAVEIYRLICRNTIEEKIYQKQIYKECLGKKILSDPRVKISKEAILDLFSYSEDAKQEPIIEEYNAMQAEEEKLVRVREEDNGEFQLMKDLVSKAVLTGEELIEFIERRELQLKTE